MDLAGIMKMEEVSGDPVKVRAHCSRGITESGVV